MLMVAAFRSGPTEDRGNKVSWWLLLCVLAGLTPSTPLPQMKSLVMGTGIFVYAIFEPLTPPE